MHLFYWVVYSKENCKANRNIQAKRSRAESEEMDFSIFFTLLYVLPLLVVHLLPVLLRKSAKAREEDRCLFLSSFDSLGSIVKSMTDGLSCVMVKMCLSDRMSWLLRTGFFTAAVATAEVSAVVLAVADEGGLVSADDELPKSLLFLSSYDSSSVTSR
jgi:hypothetical protein